MTTQGNPGEEYLEVRQSTVMGSLTLISGAGEFEPPAAGDTSWPAGKTFGQLTPAQQRAASQRAAGQLEDELKASAGEIGRIMDEAGEPEPERYRVDVLAAGERTWSNNSITHETPGAAEAAARDLFGRWMSMQKWRVVPDSTPKGETYAPGSETGPS